MGQTGEMGQTGQRGQTVRQGTDRTDGSHGTDGDKHGDWRDRVRWEQTGQMGTDGIDEMGSEEVQGDRLGSDGLNGADRDRQSQAGSERFNRGR